MAFEIAVDSLQPSIYEKKIDLADQTIGAGVVQDAGKKFTKFRLTVYFKVATAATVIALVGDTAVGMATAPVTLARASLIITVLQSMVIEGVMPAGGKQFFQLTSSAAGTYDARLELGN